MQWRIWNFHQGCSVISLKKISARHLKAIKRLSRIKEVVVDVLNNKASVIFYPTFVNVSNLILHFRDFWLQNERKNLIFTEVLV